MRIKIFLYVQKYLFTQIKILFLHKKILFYIKYFLSELKYFFYVKNKKKLRELK